MKSHRASHGRSCFIGRDGSANGTYQPNIQTAWETLRLLANSINRSQERKEQHGTKNSFGESTSAGTTYATEALRGLVDAIVLTPDQGGETLQIDLKGNLAAMLGATAQTERSSGADDLSVQVSLVAGPRNQHYLQLWHLQLWRPAA
jgi:hypothetical protein